MQKVLTKYGLAAHLAFLAVAPLFLSPNAVFWLAGLALVWLLMEPSRILDERLHESRRRVFKAILTDPLFWVSLLLILIEGARWFNNGIAKQYDAETSTWVLVEAICPFLPASVGDCAREAVACSCALIVILMGCRHALGKSARMAYCLVSSLCAGGVAAYWIVQLGMRDATALELSKCSLQDPKYMGFAFGCYLVVGMVALVAAFEQKWRKVMLPIVLSMGLTSAGLFLFAPVWSQLVFAVLFVLMTAYAFLYARRGFPASGEFTLIVLLGVALTLGVVATLFSLPEDMLDSRIAAWVSGTFFSKDYPTLREALNQLSVSVWKTGPWLGEGLGSYALGLEFHATDADWQVITVGQVAPLNGYWYLLSEQGIVGALLIACPMGFLLWTYVRQLIRGITRALPHPASWLGLSLAVAMFVNALWDVSAFTPVVLLAIFPVLAISANSFPKERNNG